MDKFWKVQGDRLAPSMKKFTNIEDAKYEAIRLANQYPENCIVVLASLGHYLKEEVTWVPHQLT